MKKKIFYLPTLIELFNNKQDILLDSEIREFGSEETDDETEYPW